MNFKFGIDKSKCSGCRTCELICALKNFGECNPEKSFIKITGNFPEPGGYDIKMNGCQHCGECVRYCAMGALYLKSGKLPEEVSDQEPSMLLSPALMPGYGGKVLRVNLTTGKVSKESLDPKVIKDYLGGRGLATYLLYKELPKGVDPLSPENEVIMASGPLSGAFVPAAGKVDFVSKSPLTGGFANSNMGGHFSSEMKYAGYDVIILEGKAEKPSYLFVKDDKVEIRSAENLWGLGSSKTEKVLKEKLGDEFQIAVIGPAGEKSVPFACVTHDFGRQAGRTGIGAVLGSKNIKAIAVRGTKEIPIANIDGMIKIGKEMFEWCFKEPALIDWQKYGTSIVVEMSNYWESFPTNNFDAGYFRDHEGLSAEKMRENIVIHDKACFSCPMACGKYSRAQKNDKYDVYVEGPEYETSALCGGNVGIGDIRDVAFANYLCDEIGLDTISTGSIIAFAIECFQKGIISERDTDGRELKFGDIDSFEYLISIIAERKNRLGQTLALGTKKASRILGYDSEKFAIQIKGLEVSGYEFRHAPGMMLSYLTSSIGAHHSDSWSITNDLEKGRDVIEGKAEDVINRQHIRPMFDNLGVCRLLWVELDLHLEKYSEVLKAITGQDYTLEDLLKISERVFNLTRAFWAREVDGFGRSWDQPPKKFLEEGVTEGKITKGKKVSQEMVDKLLDDYYSLRGWNKNGFPTKEKLKKLGLEFIIPDLYN